MCKTLEVESTGRFPLAVLLWIFSGGVVCFSSDAV